MYEKRGKPHHFYYGYSGQMIHGNAFNLPENNGFLRNQSYPYQVPFQNVDWLSYQPQNPYYPQQSQHLSPQQQGYVPEPPPFSQAPFMQQPDSQFLFQNPLQSQENMYAGQNQYPPNLQNFTGVNPYPKQNFIPKQPGGMHSLINSFKSQDGSVDFNKMMNTAGQMMNAVNQVSSLVKGLGGFFKPS